MSAKQHVLFNEGFQAEGLIDLRGGEIEGDLWCHSACFLGTPDSWNSPGLRVGGTFYWYEFKDKPKGIVNIAGARASVLSDDLESWPEPGKLLLDNFIYDAFDREQPMMKDRIYEQRLDWLRLQTPFNPQIYEQVGKVLRNMGYEPQARRIATAKKDDLRERGKELGRAARLWNKLLSVTVGHGYRVDRTLRIALIIVLAGWGIFQLSWNYGNMAPAKPVEGLSRSRCPFGQPCFNSLIYSLDVFLPIVDLEQQKHWLLAGDNTYGGWFNCYLWIHILAGWILTTLSAAALTGLIKKE